MSQNQNFVDLVYCNGTKFQHEPETLQGAIAEYCTLLGELLEPSEAHSDQVHLRQVAMTAVTEHQTHMVNSGVFPCAHKG